MIIARQMKSQQGRKRNVSYSLGLKKMLILLTMEK